METSEATMDDLPGGKADLGRRFGALLVDGLIAGVIYAILGNLNYTLGWLAYAAYILVRDGLSLEFMNGRSIGKKLLKLRIVRDDGAPMDLQTSVMRNLPMALGAIINALIWIGGWQLWATLSWLGLVASLIALVECILVLTDAEGRRFGDKFAKTHVVDSAD